MPTVMTGASSAEKGSFSGGGGKNSSSDDKDTKEQKKVLQKAAKEATPFCEECEKKKEEEKKEKEKKKEITRIFWVDEHGEQKTLAELPSEYEITLCIATKNIDEGEEIKIEITDEKGRNYKGGKKSLHLTATVEADGCAYVEKVKLEYD